MWHAHAEPLEEPDGSPPPPEDEDEESLEPDELDPEDEDEDEPPPPDDPDEEDEPDESELPEDAPDEDEDELDDDEHGGNRKSYPSQHSTHRTASNPSTARMMMHVCAGCVMTSVQSSQLPVCGSPQRRSRPMT